MGWKLGGKLPFGEVFSVNLFVYVFGPHFISTGMLLMNAFPMGIVFIPLFSSVGSIRMNHVPIGIIFIMTPNGIFFAVLVCDAFDDAHFMADFLLAFRDVFHLIISLLMHII